MEACVMHDIGEIKWEEVPKPELKPGEVLIKVKASGICGSDISRVFSKGTYHYPLIPGHEFAGEISEKGSEVENLKIGDRGAVIPLIPCGSCHFCEIGNYAQCENYDYLGSRSDGGFAEYAAVPAANFLKLPDSVSFKEGAMIEPAAVAVHALRRVSIDLGDVVTILGAGPIGIILAQIASIWGAQKVLITDIVQEKLDFAEKMGFKHVFNSRTGDPVDWVKAQTEGIGADVVVEAAGVPATFKQAILMARKNGRVTIMGNPVDDVLLKRKVISQILRKQLTLKGTWNSRFTRFPRHEWKVVIDLLARGKLDLESLITHEVSLKQCRSALEMMRDNTEFYSKVMFVNY